MLRQRKKNVPVLASALAAIIAVTTLALTNQPQASSSKAAPATMARTKSTPLIYEVHLQVKPRNVANLGVPMDEIEFNCSIVAPKGNNIRRYAASNRLRTALNPTGRGFVQEWSIDPETDVMGFYVRHFTPALRERFDDALRELQLHC